MTKGKKTAKKEVPVGESKKFDFPKNLSPWIQFLDSYRKKNPKLTLGEAMKKASKEWKKEKAKKEKKDK